MKLGDAVARSELFDKLIHFFDINNEGRFSRLMLDQSVLLHYSPDFDIDFYISLLSFLECQDSFLNLLSFFMGSLCSRYCFSIFNQYEGYHFRVASSL